MSARKQQLLKAHRRNKRLFLIAFVLALLLIGVLIAWWLVPLLLVLAWVAHEAWFADHLFYRPSDDYQYAFPSRTARQAVSLEGGVVRLSEPLVELIEQCLAQDPRPAYQIPPAERVYGVKFWDVQVRWHYPQPDVIRVLEVVLG